MKITKFEHACFVVENEGQSLVVDPGAFTGDFVVPENVVAIVITHEHQDHFNKTKIEEIIGKNPEAIIIAHEKITEQLDSLKTQSVIANEGTAIGHFELEFYGGEHATIHSSIPVIPNLGVMINGKIFYPGDSFVNPERTIEVLALPVGAPWLKLSETIDYLLATKPSLSFPTHDAVLSNAGKQLCDRMLPTFAEKAGTKYQRLLEPLEI